MSIELYCKIQQAITFLIPNSKQSIPIRMGLYNMLKHLIARPELKWTGVDSPENLGHLHFFFRLFFKSLLCKQTFVLSLCIHSFSSWKICCLSEPKCIKLYKGLLWLPSSLVKYPNYHIFSLPKREKKQSMTQGV